MTPYQKKQMITLALLFVVCVSPFAASWYLLRFTDMSDVRVSHHGTLVQPPRPVENFRLFNPAATEPETGSLHGKWSLVYLLDGSCDQLCEENIYKMRQVRLATGKYAHRLQRVVIHSAGKSRVFSARQIADYAGQLLLDAKSLQAEKIRELFDESDGRLPYGRQRIYLIDPLGNLMIFYAPDADPRGMIRDLKRLLKYSRIG